jgi:pimeloyl-ACP methyl ester carboxylesterase
VDHTPAPPEHAWTDWGGDGPVLHFAHANGFPAASYRCVIDRLTGSFRVLSMEARPLWSDQHPSGLTSWTPLVEDLVEGMRHKGLQGVIGVGHSLGGALTARAAAIDPSLFSMLILIDPVIFTHPRSWFWAALKITGQTQRFPLVRGARERREHWPDIATVRASYRAKSAFRDWTDRCLDDYLTTGFIADHDGGVRLRYPREWESRIFEVCPADQWRHLRKIQVPVVFLRGETSDTFLRSAASRAIRELRDVRVTEMDGTSHFLPWEAPDATAEEIRRFAAEVL